MIEKGDLLRLSSEVIKPFYKDKSLRAVELLQEAIGDPRFRIHKPEGAIFLWLWFDELPITTMELYDRLKARGVLIVPGEYFFIGQEDEWDHAHQCLRMNYVQDDEAMQKGSSSNHSHKKIAPSGLWIRKRGSSIASCKSSTARRDLSL